jgi:peptide/nickel transport system permease protein
MFVFLLRRTGQLILSLLIVAVLIFLIFHLGPGDPTAAVLADGFPPEVVEALRHAYGLDQPMPVQLLLFLKNLLSGELGRSFFYDQPVIAVLGEKFWNTAVLMGVSFLLAYGFGFIGGIFLAWRRGTLTENILVSIALFFRAAPLFWTGMLALSIFSYWWQILPHSGLRSPGFDAEGAWDKFVSLDFLQHLILPALVSSLYFIGTPLLITRNVAMEVIEEDFVDYARAKGLSERQVMYRHVAPNALLPVVTNAAVFIGAALGGQVLIEYVFGWPGLGRELILAVQRRDYPIAEGGFFMLAVTAMLMNFVADLLYSKLDPRVVNK